MGLFGDIIDDIFDSGKNKKWVEETNEDIINSLKEDISSMKIDNAVIFWEVRCRQAKSDFELAKYGLLNNATIVESNYLIGDAYLNKEKN